MTPLPARQRARWYRPSLRLSVRALMVVVLLGGGLLGWAMHRTRVRREALAAIQHATRQHSEDSPLFFTTGCGLTRPSAREAGRAPHARARWRTSIAPPGFDGFPSVKAVIYRFAKRLMTL